MTKEARHLLSDITTYASVLKQDIDKVVDLPRFRLYSAHDTNEDQWMYTLYPEVEINRTPFASSMYFELYREKRNESRDEQLFVKVIWNGRTIK